MVWCVLQQYKIRVDKTQDPKVTIATVRLGLLDLFTLAEVTSLQTGFEHVAFGHV